MDPKVVIDITHTFIDSLNGERRALSLGDPDEFKSWAKNEILTIIKKNYPTVDIKSEQRDIRTIFHEVADFGPIIKFLNDPEVTEIMVNGPSEIFVEKNGLLERTPQKFISTKSLTFLIARMLAPIGKSVDRMTPLADGRLPDGSRINVIVPPLAIKGPNLTIRKFSPLPTNIEYFIQSGTLTREAILFLEKCVLAKLNILISGGTGSGKTTLLNFLSSFIPRSERIVTVEDTAELKLVQEHVVPLETRPASPDHPFEITVRDLVINSLRMRPDRIIVGECRGKEALDMLQAMNTGHDGSLTTIHANSTRDTFSRLESLVLMAGVDIPILSIRKQIASAIQMVIQLKRGADGRRVVHKIAEITGMENEVILTSDLFELKESSSGKEELKQTGLVPKFIKKLREVDRDVSHVLFEDDAETRIS
jgi:pilus assembly protein CpaF